MKSSDSYNPSQNAAILVVGDPGSGKTTLAFAMPDPGIMSCGQNLNAAVRVSPGKKFWFAEGAKDDAGKEIPENARWPHCVKETKALLSDTNTKSFVLDDLSNLCRWGLTYCESEIEKSGINVRKEYLAKYQAFIPLLTNYMTMIRIPGKLVMVNVHQCTDKDEFGRMRYYLDIPGRLAETLGGQFTDVWGMSSLPDPTNAKYQAKYEIRTRPTGYHVNLKTSLDLEPAVNITGLPPSAIWSILEPKLSVNQPTNKTK